MNTYNMVLMNKTAYQNVFWSIISIAQILVSEKAGGKEIVRKQNEGIIFLSLCALLQ